MKDKIIASETELGNIKQLIETLEIRNTEINNMIIEMINLKIDYIKYLLFAGMYDDPKKTLITDWIESSESSVRLNNVLMRIFSNNIAKYIEDVNSNTLIRMRQCGIGTVREFERLTNKNNGGKAWQPRKSR